MFPSDFFENANVGIHWVGPDAVIRRVNQAELDMLGYDRAEVLGRSIADFHADADVIAEILDRLRRGEQLRQFPARLVRKDGAIRDVLISSSVYWDAGQFVHTRCITVDVTDHLRNEQELRAAQDELEETARRKDEFLATLAHELRNPLAPVRNSLEILRRSREKPGLVDQALSTMERQMTHLERLVDDLIDISRINRGWLELRKSPVELASVVFQAVETVRPMAERKGHELTVTLPTQPVFLEADPVRMTQIVTNLLTNAVKYTPDGGRIVVHGAVEPDRLALSVRDNGIGIPVEMLPRVFEMFTQIHRREEASRGGLGIGLSLVKRLVEMHDGTIEASSDGLGAGSTFTLRLPVLAGRPAPAGPAPAPVAAGAPRRILVADDNEDAARTLEALLGLSGHETRLAFDGQEALEQARRFRPDVVLLDIGMPKLSGHEAARLMRQEPWFEGTVLIALTGWGQEMDRQKSREVGFDHHLVKPIDPGALLGLIASLPDRRVSR
jgi:PAS domain S-box-containing protein